MNHHEELAAAEARREAAEERKTAARYQAHTSKAASLPAGPGADWEWTLARHAATIIGQLRREQ